MPPKRLSSFELTPRATADLEDVWDYSAEAWSVAQADRYFEQLLETCALLGRNPKLGREREELSPRLRVFRCRSHLLLYVEVGSGIMVLGFPHVRTDWLNEDWDFSDLP